jgi:hypothetical protein
MPGPRSTAGCEGVAESKRLILLVRLGPLTQSNSAVPGGKAPCSSPCNPILSRGGTGWIVHPSRQYPLYQSAHHLRTLPNMSWNPQALGCFCATGCDSPPLLALYQAMALRSP